MFTIKFQAIETISDIEVKGALALYAPAKGELSPSVNNFDEKYGGAIKRFIKYSRYQGKAGQVATIPSPISMDEDEGFERLYLFGIDESKDDEAGQELQWLDNGGALAKSANRNGDKTLSIVMDAGDESHKCAQTLADLALGAHLGGYQFLKYKTQLKPDEKPSLKRIHFYATPEVILEAKKIWKIQKAQAEAIEFTRNIVSEPGNVIHPESLAAHCQGLTEIGLNVEVFNEAKLKKLGMGALLAVGQGSVRESQLVILEWRGAAKNKAPLALVGKGVTFDTGGISIKPAGGMEDMKWDMGGSAAVIGTMIALAKRKAKANVVGVVALSENMPDGNAQRPGDVITSYSGQTIEVINTDAEGRLILADALSYTEERFKPKAMIDLATLTGAMLIALGYEYAGLFSNNDELAQQLYQKGQDTGEKLWRFPLDPVYDRMIKSEIADMRNTGLNRGAGSITAAQFLQRFVKNTPWAHLDIAGMAWNNQERPRTPKGASGFGVRLLDRLVRDHFE